MKRILLPILMAGLLVGGCSKTIDMTFVNHGSNLETVTFMAPAGTETIGTVSPSGRLRYQAKLEGDDLPAECGLSLGHGPDLRFMVTESTPSAWWFHITGDGQLAGPYGPNDVHSETVMQAETTVRSPARTVVK